MQPQKGIAPTNCLVAFLKPPHPHKEKKSKITCAKGTTNLIIQTSSAKTVMLKNKYRLDIGRL